MADFLDTMNTVYKPCYRFDTMGHFIFCSDQKKTGLRPN